jgi:myosin heavy subunit
VPDNGSLKDTLLTLVSTIIQQQEQIVLLQNSMNQMSINNATTQQNIVTWTTNCIHDLQNQNFVLQKNADASEAHIQNFVHNIQGFSDANKHNDLILNSRSVQKDSQLGILLSNPPLILATKIPTIPMDSNKDSEILQESEISKNIENTNSLLDKEVFRLSNNTEKMEDAENIIKNDSDINVGDILKDVKKPSHDSKEYYRSIKPNRMPLHDINKKWQWATRKVMNMNEAKKLQISLIDKRMMKGSSVMARLERLENETYAIPSEVNKKIKVLELNLTDIIQQKYEKLQHELDRISSQMKSQNLKNETVMDSTSLKIKKLDKACANFDRNIEQLKRTRIESEENGEGIEATGTEGKGRYVYMSICLYIVIYVVCIQICVREDIYAYIINSFMHI